MEQRGGAFSRLRSNSPEYSRAVTRFREQQRAERRSIPELETLPTVQDGERYIETHRLHTPEACLKHEQWLAQQLNEAIFLQQPEQIEKLRRDIWAFSNHTHHTQEIPSTVSEEIIRANIDKLRNTPIERLGEDPRDITKRTTDHENRMQEWISLLGAMRQHLTGHELIDALGAKDQIENDDDLTPDPLADFEYHYASLIRDTAHYHDNRKKAAKRKLEDMRIVRDRLYFDLLFPEQAKLKFRLERNSQKQRH